MDIIDRITFHLKLAELYKQLNDYPRATETLKKVEDLLENY